MTTSINHDERDKIIQRKVQNALNINKYVTNYKSNESTKSFGTLALFGLWGKTPEKNIEARFINLIF